MGEIDTKPIESVQAALTFFEHNNQHRKSSHTNDQVSILIANFSFSESNNSEIVQQQQVEKERATESLDKELANAKLQLEAKDAALKQAILKLDHYQKTAQELSTLLKNSDLKKNFYINESREATSRAAQLEDHLLQAKTELQSTHNELVVITEAKAESESRMKGLVTQISELNEAITRLEKEGADNLAANEAKLESTTKALSEAQQKNDSLQMLSERAASELKRLREEMQLQEKKSFDQAARIGFLEEELEQIRSEVENLKEDLEKATEEANEAQVEIAMLQSELHKGRSKQAAAEAAEARAQSEKSALYNALQQMGLEAEETKKENRMLKEAMKSADQEIIPYKEADMIEYEKGDGEMEDMKRELEAAMVKMGELRRRAEHATTRAEAAEKAKAALEEKNKKRKEQKERRKVALAALREESIEREIDRIKIEASAAKNYQPLGKVLNMKF